MDYANGKIYKLCSSNTPLVYIGSTCSELKKRKCNHKGVYEAQKRGTLKRGNCVPTSTQIFEAGGDITIVLVELFPCASKMELEQRERYWIENTDCVNRCIPGRTVDELKQYQQQYRTQNADHIKQYTKE